MNHHSDKQPFSDDLADLMGLGATGNFPRGKLAPHDEGEIKIAIAADVGRQRVLIDFGKSVRSLGLTGEEAEAIADMLHEKALELRGITS